MTIRIPEEYRGIVRVLAKLPPEKQQKLLDEVESFQPTSSLESFVRRLNKVLEWDERSIQAVLSLFLNAYFELEQAGESPEKVAKDIVSQAPLEEEIDEREGKHLEGFLGNLLSFETGFGLNAKAMALMTESPVVLQDSRIITDARPIFRPGRSDEVMGYTLLHTIRLTCIASQGPTKLFCSATEGELLELKAAIERALEKGQTLRSDLSKWPVVGSE